NVAAVTVVRRLLVVHCPRQVLWRGVGRGLVVSHPAFLADVFAPPLPPYAPPPGAPPPGGPARGGVGPGPPRPPPRRGGVQVGAGDQAVAQPVRRQPVLRAQLVDLKQKLLHQTGSGRWRGRVLLGRGGLRRGRRRARRGRRAGSGCGVGRRRGRRRGVRGD